MTNFKWILVASTFGCGAALYTPTGLATPALAADTSATATDQAPHPGKLTERQQSRLDRNVDGLIQAAKIEDTAVEAKVRGIMSDHFPRLWAWHERHDAELADLWGQWRDARSGDKDEAKAAGVTDQITEVYESFQPQHDRFVMQLSEVLTPEQVDAVKNRLTSSPGMMRTYNAYCDVIPEMTAEQKAHVLENFKKAREEGMDTSSSKEVADIFKKYKVLNEAYLNEQGYDWAARYKAHFYPPKPADNKPGS